MDEILRLKIQKLGAMTKAQFNCYATMDPAQAESRRQAGRELIEIYSEIASLAEMPEEPASDPLLGYGFLANYCDQQNEPELAATMRYCEATTLAVLEEMNLPEGTCPTEHAVKDAIVKVIGKPSAPAP